MWGPGVKDLMLSDLPSTSANLILLRTGVVYLGFHGMFMISGACGACEA